MRSGDMLCPAHRKGQVRVKIRRRNQHQKKLWCERRFRTGPTEVRYRYEYQKHGTSDVGIAGTNIAGTNIAGTNFADIRLPVPRVPVTVRYRYRGDVAQIYRYPVVLKGSTTPVPIARGELHLAATGTYTHLEPQYRHRIGERANLPLPC